MDAPDVIPVHKAGRRVFPRTCSRWVWRSQRRWRRGSFSSPRRCAAALPDTGRRC